MRPTPFRTLSPHPKPRDSEEQARERRADNVRNGVGGIEERDRFRSILVAKPVRQVDDDTGQKSGFGGPNEKSYKIKLTLSMDEGHQHRDHSPDNHDAGDPAPSAPALND